MQHRGAIVEYVARTSGLSFSILAARVGISRNTLYNRFKEKNLSFDFILALGRILHYNFSAHFPEMTPDAALPDDLRPELFEFERKYNNLLERYNWLLRFLLKKSQDANQHVLHEQVKALINASSF
ncbi:MAG: hypothetical protein NMK33_02900 [Candidatus Cardinium sp.]|uniref:hypothetical protein n=1 Tax=Cardinium endosymbiont of Dermatophagoides farinae TaxID=2597823 RepID=UPI0011826001|nr:hypothetical protein [Cardinium endosymbiont of Dermatophagoides farinae]TSJ81420.1 hypothetical protein FPG78_05585 [Cardinium endosymbiont of Dermatophagoides farinae]UWW97482.1 MAG: hypothetical protein NMK33_02900 [Candidatus Cardinium sp.]